MAHDSSTRVLLVGTRKDGDETTGPVDVGMLSNLVLGRLNSSDMRLASTLVTDKVDDLEEHCFFCIENKRGHTGDPTVRRLHSAKYIHHN